MTGDHLFVFSATCPVLSCFAVSDCHGPFSLICIARCSDACWLNANQSVCTHEMSFVCIVTKEGSHRDYSCNHHLPDPFVGDDPREEKESLQFCGFLSSVYRIPSRTVYTERTYQRPQSGAPHVFGTRLRSDLEQKDTIKQRSPSLSRLPVNVPLVVRLLIMPSFFVVSLQSAKSERRSRSLAASFSSRYTTMFVI